MKSQSAEKIDRRGSHPNSRANLRPFGTPGAAPSCSHPNFGASARELRNLFQGLTLAQLTRIADDPKEPVVRRAMANALRQTATDAAQLHREIADSDGTPIQRQQQHREVRYVQTIELPPAPPDDSPIRRN